MYAGGDDGLWQRDWSASCQGKHRGAYQTGPAGCSSAKALQVMQRKETSERSVKESKNINKKELDI